MTGGKKSRNSKVGYKPRKTKQERASKFRYGKYWSEKKVEEELKVGTIFRASIRYNAADKTQAFCSVEGIPTDVFICDLLRQNRSVHGDFVLIRVLPPHQWYQMGDRKNAGNVPNGNGIPAAQCASSVNPTGDLRESLSMISRIRDMVSEVKISENAGNGEKKEISLEEIRQLLETEKKGWRATGEVVSIIKPSERRSNMVGCIQQQGCSTLFVPLDKRLPVGVIVDSLHIYDHKSDSTSPKAKHYFEARLIQWDENDEFPKVQLKSILGKPGKLETDIQAILSSERINDDSLFNEEILQCLPNMPWQIPAEEYSSRKDIRSTRIFSIDPETAKDLDDALSIESIGDNLFHIGVHIADVSFFVQPGTALDRAAQERSTSVYLVDRVIPMLPRVLCEQLCSLNPGTDRLALSIFWDMSFDGEVSNIWAGRTIIKSCVKLSYQMAQSVIDTFELSGKISPTFDTDIQNNYSKEEVAKDVIALHRLAQKLREKRFKNGSLRLDNAKVAISLKDGDPTDFSLYQTGSANHLVEEFMLAANIKAANIISEAYADNALLRMHPEPNMEKLNGTAEMLSEWLPDAPRLSIESAGTVQKSLIEFSRFHVDNPEIVDVLTFLCTKPMQMAQYFNTGDMEDKELWRHYALSIPRYTHFTSPIRRYPDIIVHRLMMAAIHKQEKPYLGASSVSKVAEHANERKAAAKSIQERVSQLYLIQLLIQTPRVLWGIVVGLGGPKFFDVYVPDIGVDIRIHAEDIFVKGLEINTEWNPVSKYVHL